MLWLWLVVVNALFCRVDHGIKTVLNMLDNLLNKANKCTQPIPQ